MSLGKVEGTPLLKETIVEIKPARRSVTILGRWWGNRGLRDRTLTIISPFLLLSLWEISVQVGWLDKRFFAAPSMILSTFGRVIGNGELPSNVGISIGRVAQGFLWGSLVAILLGMLMGLSGALRSLFYPVLMAIYPIPKVAIFPLMLLIFQLGETPKIVTVGIAVFFPVMVSTLAGVVNIERIYMDVGKNFGANPFQIFSTIALPGALPFIFAGLKLGMGVAWLVLVSVEYTQSDGLGYFIWNSWKLFAVEELFVGLVTIAFMGFVSIALVDFVEKLVIRWKK